MMKPLFLLATLFLISCNSCGSGHPQEDSGDDGVISETQPLPAEGSLRLKDSLTKDLPSENGYYYKTYDVQGKALDSMDIRVKSETFIPHMKLFYGDELVAEDQGDGFYNINYNEYSEPYYVASTGYVLTATRSGAYRILVTSTEKGALGEYELEYYPCCEFNGDPLSMTTQSPMDDEGHFYHSYERPLTKGNDILINIKSYDFNPTIKIYYQGKMMAEDWDDDIHSGGELWFAQVRYNPQETGTYQIVISTVEGGATGKYEAEVVE